MPSSFFAAVASAVVGNIIGGIFSDKGGSAPTVAAPEVKPPTPMPVTPGAKEKAKAEQSLAQQMGMNRASTVLTGDSDKLG